MVATFPYRNMARPNKARHRVGFASMMANVRAPSKDRVPSHKSGLRAYAGRLWFFGLVILVSAVITVVLLANAAQEASQALAHFNNAKIIGTEKRPDLASLQAGYNYDISIANRTRDKAYVGCVITALLLTLFMIYVARIRRRTAVAIAGTDADKSGLPTRNPTDGEIEQNRGESDIREARHSPVVESDSGWSPSVDTGPQIRAGSPSVSDDSSSLTSPKHKGKTQVSGEVRKFFSNDKGRLTQWNFRLERYRASGERLEEVAVQTGYIKVFHDADAGGRLNDGDRVTVEGTFDKSGLFRASRIRNHSAGTVTETTTAPDIFGKGACLLFVILIVAVILIVITHLGPH